MATTVASRKESVFQASARLTQEVLNHELSEEALNDHLSNICSMEETSSKEEVIEKLTNVIIQKVGQELCELREKEAVYKSSVENPEKLETAGILRRVEQVLSNWEYGTSR